ncbi:cytochrome P450 [Hyaloraphidium curvatum]|nr:cytochrome P450 [Hyaloraphidium curvatum]
MLALALSSAPVLAVAVVLLIASLAFVYPKTVLFSRIRNDVPVADGGLPLVGHQFALGRNVKRRLERLVDVATKYGEVVRTTIFSPVMGIIELYFCTNLADVEFIYRNPDLFIKGQSASNIARQLLGYGIFVSDGHEWRVQRKTASNVFNLRNFRDTFQQIFMAESKDLCGHLGAAADRGLVIDIQDLLLRGTLESFAQLAMGLKVHALDGPFAVQESRDAKGDLQKKYTLPIVEYLEAFDLANAITASRGPNPFWRYTERWNGTKEKMEWAIGVLDAFAQKVITAKRKSGKAPPEGKGDILDLFLALRKEDGSEWTDIELRDIVMNFLIAGRDTTAQTLSWLFWELSRNPQVEKKLREEIIAVVGKTGDITYDQTKEMKYANAVFNETLRLHANVPAQARRAAEDCVLPGTGTPIYKGNAVQVSSYAMGYLERIWGPDAKTFRPERWIDEKGSLIKENQFKWPVFNAGPRICLGMNMATQEGIIFLAAILREFTFNVVNEDKPSKWGSPETREGRYVLALSLGLRDGLEATVSRV